MKTAVTALRADPSPSFEARSQRPLATIEAENQRLRLRTQRFAGWLHRKVNEIEGLWRMSETLGRGSDGPATLAMVTQTVGELTEAGAATVLLEAGREVVVASRWGALTLPIGTKSPDVRGTLEHDFDVTAAEPVADAGRPIGLLWIGRTTGVGFTNTERLILKTLASMTSLAITTLRERTRSGTASYDNAAAAGDAAAPDPSATVRPEPLPEPLHPTPETLRVANLPAVPAFSPTLARLLDPRDADPDVEGILRLDPVLAGLVVRAAGSAALAHARPAASIDEAVRVLGIRGVRQLAAAQFARGLCARSGPIECYLWEQAIGTAVRTQTALETLLPAAADAGYLGGLLHNVGAIALHNAHPERYERVLKSATGGDQPIGTLERAEFGIDGPAVTAELLTRWHVPPAMLVVLHAPQESLLGRALDWAEHATLAANPAWNGLRMAAGAGTDDAWFTARCRRAALELGWNALDGPLLERRSRERVETLRNLLHP